MGFFWFMVCSNVCLLRIFTVFSHVTFVLFILVYKTIKMIQPSIALAQLFVLLRLHSVLCLTISPWVLLPFLLEEEKFHLTCCWTSWSLSLSVSSLKYAPQLTQQSWSCSYSDQSLECAVVSSLFTYLSFPRKPKYGSGKRKVVLLLLNPHLGTELWILHVFYDHVSASPTFAVQLNRHDTNDMYLILYKK